MKIAEVMRKLSEELDLGPLSRHFYDENAFKRQVVEVVDLMCATYRKTYTNNHGMAPFSNAIGDKMREYLIKMIVQTYGIKNNQEIQQVRSLIVGFISDKYLEYKINDIAPGEEYERGGFYESK